MGQRWGDKIKRDYESHQQGGDKMPPATTSTDAMDTEGNATAMSSLVFPEYEELNEKHARKWQNTRS